MLVEAVVIQPLAGTVPVNCSVLQDWDEIISRRGHRILVYNTDTCDAMLCEHGSLYSFHNKKVSCAGNCIMSFILI